MADYGFWSIVPPVFAIFLAIRTKQVYIALLFGIWAGWLVISDWNPLQGTLAAVQALVNVFDDAGNTRTIMFSALVGALLLFIQRSGGVDGFMLKIGKLLDHYENRRKGSNRIIVQILALATGVMLFIETSISALTVGSLYRPVFDKLKISREKLAYIADSAAAPSAILIPLNAWGAYIMGLLVVQGIDQPFTLMLAAFPFNFYPMLAILAALIVILTKKDFGEMKKAEKRTRETGKLMNDGSRPMMSNDITFVECKENVRPKARNMIIPMAVMVGMMPVTLIYTGWATTAGSNTGFSDKIITAIGNGSGSSAVLYSVLTSLIVAAILYRVQKIMKLKEIMDLGLKGISSLMPLALLMMLAFAISTVCKELGTGLYVAEIAKSWLTPALVPVIIYLTSSFIAFSTGTSWGTFAIMLSVTIPMAQSLGINLPLAVAAALGGGVFGDHCSPISDTTIIASMASASDHIDHVRTQLPYAIINGLITAFIYLILGFLMQ